jgi:hypothetical protein
MFVQKCQPPTKVTSDQPHIFCFFFCRTIVLDTDSSFHLLCIGFNIGYTTSVKILYILGQREFTKVHVDEVKASGTAEPIMVPNFDDMRVLTGFHQL